MVWFIEGTVLGIARPKAKMPQSVVYNGQNRRNSLKYQAVNAPDGLIMHVAGTIKGRIHDWTLYVRSGLDENLPDLLGIRGTRYRIYGDRGYNKRWFMEDPFEEEILTPAHREFNKAM